MKKKIHFLSAVLGLIVSISATSCGNSEKKPGSPAQSQDRYECPMKCTEEVFDAAGQCPVCGMDLEKGTNI